MPLPFMSKDFASRCLFSSLFAVLDCSDFLPGGQKRDAFIRIALLIAHGAAGRAVGMRRDGEAGGASGVIPPFQNLPQPAPSTDST